MKRWILILFGIAAVGALISWRLFTKAKDTQMQAQGRSAASKAAPPVTVAPVETRDVVQTFIGVGSVVAPLNVKIAPKVSGRLDYLQVREGAAVHVGEVLARIDPSQIQAMVSEQQAAVAEAESKLAQAQFTQKPTNVNVETQIEQQTAGLNTAKADYELVKQNAAAQLAAAHSAVTDAEARVDSANSAIMNADANVRSAQASLDNAQVKYNRTYDLYKQGFVAAQDVDDVKTAVKVQDETLSTARSQLRGAKSAHDSAVAQKNSADEQAAAIAAKGKSDVAAARSKVLLYQSTLKYAKSNTAQRPAYEQAILALRASVDAAKAQLRNVQSQLSDTTLTSPITGSVSARYVDPGAIVSPSQPIIAVQAISDVFVDVAVPEDIAGRLRPGQPTDVSFDGLPGRKYRGDISQITPAADPQSRQFPVRVTLLNRDNAVKPGMFARVSIVTQRVPNALVVPREAISHGKLGTTVTVVDSKSVAHIRIVRTGAEDAKGIQILEGVQPKELVVTLTMSAIKDGQNVRMIDAVKRGAGDAKSSGRAEPRVKSGNSGS